METPDIRLSVALVTRNRPDSLNRCLQSLREQSVQPFEVVVSDDSDPELVAQTEAVAKKWDCRYIIGPRRGLYANRNRVALACQGTHIRTMDDDHTFPDGHLENCTGAIASDPEAVWIIAEYVRYVLEEKPTKGPILAPDELNRPGQLHPRGFSVPPEDPQRCWAISDGASIYPKMIFDRGVRYSEHFKFGALYLEFGSRLYWLGYRMRNLDSTYVMHWFEGRSVMDDTVDLSAVFFAMLCHSLIYQKTLKNQFLTLLEISKRVTLSYKSAMPALVSALQAYNEHRQLVRLSV